MSHYILGRPQRVSGTVLATTSAVKIPNGTNAGYITGVQGSVAVIGRISANSTTVITAIKAAAAWVLNTGTASGGLAITLTAGAAGTAQPMASTTGVLPGMQAFSRGIVAGTALTNPTRVVSVALNTSVTFDTAIPGAGAATIADFGYFDFAPVTTTHPTYALTGGADIAGSPWIVVTPTAGYGPCIMANTLAITVGTMTVGAVLLAEFWPVFLADGLQSFADPNNLTAGTAMPTTVNLV